MNVVGLFDGISCGQVSLQRAGITVDNYYASEIDKNAIQVTMNNFPNTIQLGDVSLLNMKMLKSLNIDLLIGGSPCQGFSFAGKQLNFNDPRSKLFFEYVKILNAIRPKYFLLENVVMKKEYQDTISHYLGVEPIRLNSSLVSAQNRDRLYWTNIKNIKVPKDKNICLNDILENTNYTIPGEYYGMPLNKGTIIGRRLNANGHREDYNKSIPVKQCLEIRKTNTHKSNCLTTVKKDNVLSPLSFGRHPDAYTKNLPFRYYTVKEYCRLQTLSDEYMLGCPESIAKKLLGNAWTVDIIVEILKCIIDSNNI